ncbi:MAG: tetratricopeptide repeat protein [Pirellulaceae bacterium]
MSSQISGARVERTFRNDTSTLVGVVGRRAGLLTVRVAGVMRGLLGLLLLTLAVFPVQAQDEPASQPALAPASGDESTETTLTPREQLVAAYMLSQESPSVETYSHIIEVCEATLADELSMEDRRYARQLASWAYTMRADERIDLEQVEPEASGTARNDLDFAIEYDSANWRARVLRGVLNGAEKRYDEAIADLDSAIKINDKSVVAWYNRAELRYQVGDFVLATYDYGRALELNPRDTQAYVGRGHAYFQLGRFRESLEDYKKVVLLTSGSAQSLLFRGDAYTALSQWDAARDDYQLAVARASESSEAHRKLAWLLATCPDLTVANPRQAVTLARRAHELDAESWESVEALATALAATDQLTQAVELINAWTLENPEAAHDNATALRDSLQSRIE